MRQRLRSHLTYANVMVTILAFVVLGGVAWAAAKVGPRDIQSNAVHTRHINNGAVRATKLARIIKVKSTVTVANHDNGQTGAECPAGSRMISGGASGATFAMPIVGSKPNADGEIWVAAARNDTGQPQDLTAYALCLKG
ncbi:MAG: hypothetical protein U0R52_10840 [Solirubrobacterales bacterium]